MKAIILAGGLGTRLSEETALLPKPMVEVGGMPILWHIMKTYASHGINDFVVCCGYKGAVIKDYFVNYRRRMADLTVDLAHDEITVHSCHSEPWRVALVDTGTETMTGGRLRRVREHVGDETFALTYGDGVCDVDLGAEIEFHKRSGLAATMLAVQPPGRFGALVLGENQTRVDTFYEKPEGDGAWINGGYFVLEPEVIDRIEGDDTVWEQGPLRTLAHQGQLNAYKHNGFWQPMDTLRDRTLLEQLWHDGQAPWKVW